MEFWELALRWVRWKEGSGSTARSLYEARLRLRNHILPFMGDWELERIQRADAQALYLRVAGDGSRGSRGHVRGGHGVARRVVRHARAMLSYAVDVEGALDANPWARWKAPTADGMRTAIVRTVSEYATLEAALDGLELRFLEGDRAEGIRPAVADLLRVLACTGLRLGEAQALRWSEVDLAGRHAVVERSKAKALGRISIELVELPPLAMAALRRRWEATCGVGLVFQPSRGERVSCQREFARVRRAAGLHPKLTIHGLRHSLATHAVAAGASTLEVQQLLRHASPATTARYIHPGEMVRGRETTMWERITGNGEGRGRAGAAPGADAGGSGERSGDQGAEQAAGGGDGPPGGG